MATKTKTKAVKKTATKKAVKKTATKKVAKKTATKKVAKKTVTAAATKKAVKKTATKKPATKKAVKKTVTKKSVSKMPRGYKIKMVVRELNLPADIGGKDNYELYEVSGAKVGNPRYFISEKAAREFVAKTERFHLEVKAVLGKGHAPIGMRSVATATADIMASTELADVAGGPKSDRKEAKVMYSDSE